MVSFLPTPYLDELLYSVFARYHVRSGNISSKMTMMDLFGNNNVSAAVDMPGHIDAMVTRLPKENKLNALGILVNNTLFPYYTVFLPQERIDSIFEIMKGSNGTAIHALAGITASTICISRYLKFCPVCNKENIQKYGEYYWHSIHQAPGIQICPIHGTVLMDSEVDLQNKNRHEFISANEENCKMKAVAVEYKKFEIDICSMISKNIEFIIKNFNYIRNDINLNESLCDRYLSILKQKGYATVNNQVWQEKLIADFNNYWGQNMLKELQSEVEYEKECNWLSNIVRKHRKTFHPIRHVLMMCFLSGSVKEFFENKQEYLPFGKGPWPCLNPAAIHYKECVIDNIKITHCLDTKLPVGTFECTCGFVYSRKGPDVSKANLFKIGRIKCFGPIWEEKLCSLINEGKYSLRTIARKLEVDPKTVKVYSQKLGVGNLKDGSSNISDNYKVYNDSQEMIEYHRNTWIHAQIINPNASKTELRKMEKAHYTWLYRHDREWLYTNSPKPKELPVKNCRVDWNERDIEILEVVIAVAKDITAINGKPVRISLSKIGKVIGMLGLLEKHLDKMPETQQYIKSVVETDSDFRKRRITWAVKELSGQGTEAKIWNVMKKAGIRSEYKNEVEKFILNEIGKADN